MAKAPKCKRCSFEAGRDVHHWSGEPHVWESNGTKTVKSSRSIQLPSLAEQQNEKERLFVTLVTENRQRGRPKKPDALSNAERQRRYRERKQQAKAVELR